MTSGLAAYLANLQENLPLIDAVEDNAKMHDNGSSPSLPKHLSVIDIVDDNARTHAAFPTTNTSSKLISRWDNSCCSDESLNSLVDISFSDMNMHLPTRAIPDEAIISAPRLPLRYGSSESIHDSDSEEKPKQLKKMKCAGSTLPKTRLERKANIAKTLPHRNHPNNRSSILRNAPRPPTRFDSDETSIAEMFQHTLWVSPATPSQDRLSTKELSDSRKLRGRKSCPDSLLSTFPDNSNLSIFKHHQHQHFQTIKNQDYTPTDLVKQSNSTTGPKQIHSVQLPIIKIEENISIDPSNETNYMHKNIKTRLSPRPHRQSRNIRQPNKPDYTPQCWQHRCTKLVPKEKKSQSNDTMSRSRWNSMPIPLINEEALEKRSSSRNSKPKAIGSEIVPFTLSGVAKCHGDLSTDDCICNPKSRGVELQQAIPNCAKVGLHQVPRQPNRRKSSSSSDSSTETEKMKKIFAYAA